MRSKSRPQSSAEARVREIRPVARKKHSAEERIWAMRISRHPEPIVVLLTGIGVAFIAQRALPHWWLQSLIGLPWTEASLGRSLPSAREATEVKPAFNAIRTIGGSDSKS